jgi:hypothetical protein
MFNTIRASAPTIIPGSTPYEVIEDDEYEIVPDEFNPHYD